MALRNLSLDRTSINCQVGRSFTTECFCVKPETLTLLRTWFIVEDMIHSVDSASEQHLKCSIIVSLGSTDLN